MADSNPYALSVRSDLDIATLPQGYIPGAPVDEKVLSLPTPDTQKKFLDLGDGRGYHYVRGEYVIEMLNKAYGVGKWWHEVERSDLTPPTSDGKQDIIVSVRLFVPGGPSRGYPGLGSDTFNPKNKNDNLANTYLSAETRALKRAARYLGIGLDVNDNPNEGAAIEGAQNTISTLCKQLVEQGKWESVQAVFLEHAEQAIDVVNKEIKPGLLTEHQLTPVKKALIAAMRVVTLQ